jgi:hypothetical protein
MEPDNITILLHGCPITSKGLKKIRFLFVSRIGPAPKRSFLLINAVGDLKFTQEQENYRVITAACIYFP